MITVELQGGLGNQLFQLAFLEYIAKKTGRTPFISTMQSPITVHSNQQYFQTIFKNWSELYNPAYSILVREHPHFVDEDWNIPTENIMFRGYFQKYKYTDPIKDNFISKLSFNKSILNKYPNISTKIAIHIRGGDYKGNVLHEQPLTNYYKRCMELCQGYDFVIFTNDIPYAKKVLPGYPIIEENEVDSLLLMSKCAGCICVNSTFSWWGAFMNRNRPIYLPSVWWPNPKMDASGLYFPECKVIEL